MAGSILTDEEFAALERTPPRSKLKPVPGQVTPATGRPTPVPPPSPPASKSILSDEDFDQVQAGRKTFGRPPMPVRGGAEAQAVSDLYASLPDHSAELVSTPEKRLRGDVGYLQAQRDRAQAEGTPEGDRRAKALRKEIADTITRASVKAGASPIPSPPPKKMGPAQPVPPAKGRPGQQGMSRLPENAYGLADSADDPTAFVPWAWGVRKDLPDTSTGKSLASVFFRKLVAEQGKTRGLYDAGLKSGSIPRPPALSGNPDTRKQQAAEIAAIREPVEEYVGQQMRRYAEAVKNNAGVNPLVPSTVLKGGIKAAQAVGELAQGKSLKPSPELNAFLDSIRPEQIEKALGRKVTPLQRQALKSVAAWQGLATTRANAEGLAFTTDAAVNLVSGRLGFAAEGALAAKGAPRVMAGLGGAAVAGGTQEGAYSKVTKPNAPTSEHLKAAGVGALTGAAVYGGLKGAGVLARGVRNTVDDLALKADIAGGQAATGAAKRGQAVRKKVANAVTEMQVGVKPPAPTNLRERLEDVVDRAIYPPLRNEALILNDANLPPPRGGTRTIPVRVRTPQQGPQTPAMLNPDASVVPDAASLAQARQMADQPATTAALPPVAEPSALPSPMGTLEPSSPSAPAIAPTAAERERRWVWRGRNGTGEALFASTVQRDLYALGSRARGVVGEGEGVGNPNLGPTDRLRASLAQRLGVGPSDVDRIAGIAYDDVRAQMQDLGAGEQRALADTLTGLQPDNPTTMTGSTGTPEAALPRYATSFDISQASTPEQAARVLVQAAQNRAGAAGSGATVNVPLEEIRRAGADLGLNEKRLVEVMRRHGLDGPGVLAVRDQLAALAEQAHRAGRVWQANQNDETLLAAQLALKELQATHMSLTGGQDARRALQELRALRLVKPHMPPGGGATTPSAVPSTAPMPVGPNAPVAPVEAMPAGAPMSSPEVGAVPSQLRQRYDAERAWVAGEETAVAGLRQQADALKAAVEAAKQAGDPQAVVTAQRQYLDALGTYNGRLGELARRRTGLQDLEKRLAASPPREAEPVAPEGVSQAPNESPVEVAKKRIYDRLFRLNSGVDPELLQEMLQVGGHYMKNGLDTYAKWQAEMRERVGVEAVPHLRDVWDQLSEEDARRNATTRLLKAMGGRDLTEKQVRELADLPHDPEAVARWARDEARTPHGEFLHTYWVGNVLSGPPTHLRNLLSNSVMAGGQLVERPLTVGIDALLARMPGRSGHYTREELLEAFAGSRIGAFEGSRKALSIVLNGASLGDASVLELGRYAELPGGVIPNLSNRLMLASDVMFKSIAFHSELAALAARRASREGLDGEALQARVVELLERPSATMVDQATRKADWMTFTDDPDRITERFLGLRDFVKLPKNVPLVGGARPFAFFAHFVNTGINLAKRSVEYSPVGLAKGVTQLSRDTPEAAESLARGLMGTAALAGFASYAAQGNITGDVPKDDVAARKFWQSGKQPFSVRVGPHWVSYQGLGPLAPMLRATAEAAESFQKTGKFDAELVGEALKGATLQARDSTFLKNLHDLYDAITHPERRGSYFGGVAQGFVPAVGLLRSVDRATDPVKRENETFEARQKMGFGERVGSGIPEVPGLPFTAKTSPPLLTPLGQPVREPYAAFNAVSPLAVQPAEKVPQDAIEAELMAQGYRPKAPRKTLVEDDTEIELTPSQYRKRKELRGQAVYRALGALFASDEYQQASAEDKRWLIAEEMREAGEEAGEDFLDLLDGGRLSVPARR